MLVGWGRFTMDTPVSSVLPESDDLPVVEESLLRRPSHATAADGMHPRHLLSHTLGLAYKTFDAKQAAYQRIPGTSSILDGSRVAAAYMTQLMPFCDPAFIRTYVAVERQVYQFLTG